jgi:hypothetical protein
VIYPKDLGDAGDFLLADLNESDVPRLRALQRSDEWRTVAERGDFVLLERVEP